MDVKKVMLLIGALVIAATTAILAKNMFTGAGAPQAEASVVAGPEVLVATRAMPVGTIIDAEAFRYQAWPEGLVQDAYYVKGKPGATPKDLIGTVVRNEITAGQPITQGALIRPGERGFLAAALSPGMRAVTVAVDKTTSVAGFVFPGDRVDIVLTQEVKGEGSGSSTLKVSETILQNVRVLAADQRTTSKDADGKPVLEELSTVTLEATPKIAEKIAVAQTVGKLSLSLRALADNNAELERAIASGEANIPDGIDPKAEKQMLLSMASKPIDSAPTVTLGSDVSRYQRRTVPTNSVRNVRTQPEAAAADMFKAITRGVNDLKTPSSAGPTVRVSRGNEVSIVPVGAGK